MRTTKEKGPSPEKVEEVEALRGILETSKAAILTDFRGLNVKSMSALRKRLRDSDATFRVVKNTLIKRAAEGLAAEPLVKDIEGPTAVAYTEGDPVNVAKTLTGFIREFKLPVIKGGFTDGFMMDPSQVQALATVPPRPVLLAQVVGGLQAPVASLVGTMQQLYAGFVYTLQGVADKRQQ
ncbi:MAG: 50S ribosomal protein L10 [Armatimonadetes bacterium]|nr:50S ribosomal protein L10 [Armatimonadota bacterium]